MPNTIDSVINEISDFTESEFSMKPERSKLRLYSDKNWVEFCKANNFNEKSSGLYVPKSLTAYVNADNDDSFSNISHEYFGHGLFCEYSVLGKMLVESGNEHDFLNKPVDYKKQIFGLCSTNLQNYEGFAVWLESIIYREIDANLWEKRKMKLSPSYLEVYELINRMENELTRKGIMKCLGFL